MKRLAISASMAAMLSTFTAAAPCQDVGTRRAAAMAYIAAYADREEMMMIPVRDGIRLSSLILFPKGQPRQNLPTILVYNPYLTESMLMSYSEYAASALRNGYAFM